MTTVDELAQIIRQVDGNHSIGAGALAEAIIEKLPHIAARQPVGAAVKDSLTVGGGQVVSNAIDMGYWGGPHIGLMLNKDWPEHSGRVYLGAPAQAVDLGELRSMLGDWKNSDYPFSYEGQCAQRALDACVADLQRWLDSKAPTND